MRSVQAAALAATFAAAAAMLFLALIAPTAQDAVAAPLVPPPDCSRVPRIGMYVERDPGWVGLPGDHWRMTLYADDRFLTKQNGVQSLTVTRIDNLRVVIADALGPHTQAPASWTLAPSYHPLAYSTYVIYLERAHPGRTFVAISLRDRCGPWSTFWGTP